MSKTITPLWSITDAAQYLQVPTSAIYKMTSAQSTNPIPHVKLGGRLRFRKADIDEWLDVWAISPTEQLAHARQQAERV